MRLLRTGANLRADLLNLEITRKPIIQNFLFDRDVAMITSTAGAGKSIFCMNLLASLSFPINKFLGSLTVYRPCRVLYLQCESDYEETIERLRCMEQDGGLIIDEKNLCIMDAKFLNVLDYESVKEFFALMNLIPEFIPEVCILDPLYKIAGDISKGENAHKLVRFSDMIMEKWKCSNVLINHTTKETFSITQEGKKEEKDNPYYGHSYLQNHIRTGWIMKKGGNENERIMIRKKGRGADTVASFAMEYDQENMILTMSDKISPDDQSCITRIIAFSMQCKKQNRTTTFNEVQERTTISAAHLKRLKYKKELDPIFEFFSGVGRTQTWKPL